MPTINFSGLASGIDTEALIKATSDAARAQRVLPSQKKIQDFDDTNTALTDLKTKLLALQTKTNPFKTSLNGPLTKGASSSDETILTATASNSASNGTYTLRVSNLASSGSYSADDRFTDPAVAMAPSLAAPGSITVTIGTETPIVVPVTATTTLNDIVTAINDGTTKGTASIVNTGQTPPYALVVKSNSTGVTEGTVSFAASTELTTNVPPLFASGTTVAGEDAAFTITGIAGSISSATNSVTGVIPGVTLNLVSEAPTTDVTITIADDKAATTSKVQDFVSAYNDIITYLAEQNKITREERGASITNTFGPLASSRIDENAIISLRNAMSQSTYTEGEYVRIIADLGISTERDGTLKFDSAKFQENLAKEPDSVNQVLKNFGDLVAAANGVIDQQTRLGGVIANAITSNKAQITDLNDRIARAEANISKQESDMRARFSRLESITSQMQSQQAQLTSALAGLGN
ncbi:MAG: flagellar filament capping protein FliD [Deltaproteobacteria bacterium]|nr:flagellar filament capping protein FliD [Deltaproteobacteria bacterium]